jgi:spore coat polysaccharide biosynthesis protein SpsF
MTLAILQARMSSRRLPGKVLAPILGRPMLALQIERLNRCKSFDRLIVATSNQPDDEPVAALAEDCGVDVHRGALDDVLDRFYGAALPHAPTRVVRLTGDCPLADWTLVDRLVAFAINGGYDLATNAIRRTFPKGLDAEVVTFESLETAWREATAPDDREHVLEYLYKRPERFRLGSYEGESDLSSLRWTVDEAADLTLVTRIYEALYPVNPAFSTADIVTWLAAHPDVAALNAHLDR